MKTSVPWLVLRLTALIALLTVPVAQSWGGAHSLPKSGAVHPKNSGSDSDDAGHECYRHYYSSEDPEVRKALAWVEMGYMVGMQPKESQGYREGLKEAKKILLLAEGFGNRSGQFSLVPGIKNIVPN